MAIRVDANLTTKVTSSGRVKIVSSFDTKQKQVSRVGVKGSRLAETASFSSAGNSVSMSPIGGNNRMSMDKTLTGIVDENNLNQLYQTYADIYNFDPVCGSAVDLQASLPFSDFDLYGVDEKKVEVYQSAINRLNFKSHSNRRIMTSALVYGFFAGTSVYNRVAKAFTDLLPYQPTECELKYMPFLSMDPLITVTPGQELQEFLTSSEESIAKLRRLIPANLISAMGQGAFELDPLTTLYFALNGPDGKPRSYFHRVLPIHILEKTLLRGTLVEAAKRQRSLVHVTSGTDDWIPSPDELTAIVSLFQQADLDPLGPIIATRHGIEAAEIRQGGDFWKVTELWNDTTPMKLKALGISDAFLSGETTFASAESALAVFIDQLKATRDHYTQTVFYNKLFPVIASVNGFTKQGAQANPMYNQKSNMGFQVNDSGMYEIPSIRWHKTLAPERDRDSMDLLQTLSDKGFPVPLRLWAAAGGLRLEDLEKELDEDLILRKKFQDYNSKIETLTGGDLEGGDGYTEESSVFDELDDALDSKPLLARDFGELGEVVGRTKTGKATLIVDQKSAKERENAALAKALESMSDPNRRVQVMRRVKRTRL